MSPLDAFWHLSNFFAPAWVVAAVVAAFAKLLWRREFSLVPWRRLAFWGGLGGSLGLLAALVGMGQDGSMAGYGLLLLTVVLPQWWLGARK